MGQAEIGHIEAGGVRYGYETHGSGAPVLLLHGGLGTLEMFGGVRDRLAARRLVIAVDLYGHGRTALTDRPIDPIAMADDMANLVGALGFTRVDALGFSFGAMVAFRLAVQHPEGCCQTNGNLSPIGGVAPTPLCQPASVSHSANASVRRAL